MATAKARLLEVHQTLTPADHQTHRHLGFSVPAATSRLSIEVRYAPKYLDETDSRPLARAALAAQANHLVDRVGAPLARGWTARQQPIVERERLKNLLTIALDDASGVFRGAGHRQAPVQQFVLATDEATPGLVPGSLPAGVWRLTLSAHTLISPQVDVSIQIGAEIDSSSPSAS